MCNAKSVEGLGPPINLNVSPPAPVLLPLMITEPVMFCVTESEDVFNLPANACPIPAN